VGCIDGFLENTSLTGQTLYPRRAAFRPWAAAFHPRTWVSLLWNLYFPTPQDASFLYPVRRDSAAVTEAVMLDLIFVVAGLAFFAVAVAYTFLCERL
jgi:hypothetical protein